MNIIRRFVDRGDDETGSVMPALARALKAVRPGNWWFSKIPPLLAVVCLDILRVGADPAHAQLLLGCYLWSIMAIAAYGHVINDAFDVESDESAGKPNQMAGVSWLRRAGLCVALLLAGFAPALIVEFSHLTLLLVGLNYLWPTIYSVPPTRLKERGLAGLACDMLGSHVTPTLIALSLFGITAPPGSNWFAVILTLWSAVLGVKGILHHQVQDRDNDIRSDTVTYVTRASPQALSRFLTGFNLGVELPVSAALAYVTRDWAPCVTVALLAYCALETAKYRFGFQFALTSEAWTIRRSVPFINEAFYVFWVPLAAALQLAATGLRWVWVPIILVLGFYPNASTQLTDIRAVLRVARMKMKGAS
jgi:hypothetical protein